MTETRPTDEINGAALIAAERQRQIDVEGWTPEHDDEHGGDTLTEAAECYRHEGRSAKPPTWPRKWPWAAEWWKPKGRPRNLIRAGALYLAAIESYERTGTTRWAVPRTNVEYRINLCRLAIDEIAQEIDEWLAFAQCDTADRDEQWRQHLTNLQAEHQEIAATQDRIRERLTAERDAAVTRAEQAEARIGIIRKWATTIHGGTKAPIDVWPGLAAVLADPAPSNAGEATP